MKRALIPMVGLVVAMAAVGCGKNNPAGPNVLTTSPSTLQDHIYVDPTRASSATSPEERLIGTWKTVTNGGHAMAFRKGGKIEVTSVLGDGPPLTTAGSYKATDYKLTLEVNANERDKANVFMFTTYTYTLEGDTLTLTGPDGKATAWKKA